MSKDLTAALQRMTENAQGQTSRVDKLLPEPKVVSPVPERVGSSPPIISPGASGIASPLTETAYADREFFTSGVLVESVDLLFSVLVKPVKSVKFKDANDALVKMIYKEPA